MKKQTYAAAPHVSSIACVETEERGYKKRSDDEESLSIDSVIRFLRQWKGDISGSSRQIKTLERDLNDKDEELSRLREQNERLSLEVNNVQTDYRAVNDDYKTLIQIMDRARTTYRADGRR